MTSPPPLQVTVAVCQRCGQPHTLPAWPLTNPTDQFRHWAMCPALGEPLWVVPRQEAAPVPLRYTHLHGPALAYLAAHRFVSIQQLSHEFGLPPSAARTLLYELRDLGQVRRSRFWSLAEWATT